MDFGNLVTFNLALLVAVASPGPALLYSIRTTLGNGRKAGIFSGCGLAVMAATWTLMALLGLDGLFRLFPWAYAILKTIGALYLIYIAWGAWRSASDPIRETTRHNAWAFGLDSLQPAVLRMA